MSNFKKATVSAVRDTEAVDGLLTGDHWVPVYEQPLFTPKKLKMVCIGAGYSGLMLAHKVKWELKLDHFLDLTIYEKNHDIGGTWLENVYPGVAWFVECIPRLETQMTDMDQCSS